MNPSLPSLLAFLTTLPELLCGQILVPPLPPENLILLPLLLLAFLLLFPFIELRKPLRSCSILFFLCREAHHAVVHGFLLRAAEERCGEGAVGAAGCELYNVSMSVRI